MDIIIRHAEPDDYQALHHIYSQVKLYERFGFVNEGTLVKYAFRDGQYVDAYSMARIKSSDLE